MLFEKKTGSDVQNDDELTNIPVYGIIKKNDK